MLYAFCVLFLLTIIVFKTYRFSRSIMLSYFSCMILLLSSFGELSFELYSNIIFPLYIYNVCLCSFNQFVSFVLRINAINPLSGVDDGLYSPSTNQVNKKKRSYMIYYSILITVSLFNRIYIYIQSPFQIVFIFVRF